MQQTNLNDIENIIFDLGVVLLDLDFEGANEEFKKIGLTNFNDFYSKVHANNFFFDFETGKISNDLFIGKIKEFIGRDVDDNAIKNAWNTIIKGFPNRKIEFIKTISRQYNIFMLSNTNKIHAEKYEDLFLRDAGKNLESYFKGVYYSHTLGHRKPSQEAFTAVLAENNLVPEKTIFIDDIEENLKPAELLNIKTIHYKKDTDLFAIFNL